MFIEIHIKLTINYLLHYPILLWAICIFVNLLASLLCDEPPFMVKSYFMLKKCLLKTNRAYCKVKINQIISENNFLKL